MTNAWRELFSDGGSRLSFGRAAAGVAVVAWAALVAFAAVRGGPSAAVEAFSATAPQLAVLVGAGYGVSRAGDAVASLRGGGAPHPPRDEKE
ncbi:hypothetical protein LLG88_00630 [bacterium]|nr:hypothetical protein [bacterium]